MFQRIISRAKVGKSSRGIEEEAGEVNRKSGIAYAAGFALFASVISLTGVGWLLDRWFGTSPWLLVAGLVLGAAAGFYEFITLTSKLE